MRVVAIISILAAALAVGALVTFVPDPAPAPEPAASASTSGCDPSPSFRRVHGADRVATAVAGSLEGWSASDTVVVASAADFPDALAAGSLAAARGAPILLTLPDHLPDTVAAEVERLGAGRVLVVGGPAAIHEDVLDALRATSERPAVERVRGADRYGTAAAAATAAGAPTGVVSVVSGERFPDAVAAGALTVGPDAAPVLLTTREGLHDAARGAVADLGADTALVVGGPAVLGERVVEDLEGAGLVVTRLHGPDRLATSAAVTDRVLDADPGIDGVIAATASTYPDALAATPLAARLGAATLLVPGRALDLPDPTRDTLDGHADRLPCNVLLGGRSAVSVQTAEQLAGVLGVDPPDGPPVLVGAGDIAWCGGSGDEATAALLDGLEGTVVTFGDNVYDRGTEAEFRDCFLPSWGRHLDRTRPALGNHDYGTTGATPYFDLFGPAAGERGEGWYSYDLGPWWHVVALNSNCWAVGGCGPGSPQLEWLEADLEAHAGRNVLAYWHHPRFSSGAHGSSDATAPFWQVLDEHGADLVLAGHDHTYERFAPADASGAATADGIRSFVVGTGGRNHYAFRSPPHALTEARNDDTFGVIVLTLRRDAYDWEFVPVAGRAFTDRGTSATNDP